MMDARPLAEHRSCINPYHSVSNITQPKNISCIYVEHNMRFLLTLVGLLAMGAAASFNGTVNTSVLRLAPPPTTSSPPTSSSGSSGSSSPPTSSSGSSSPPTSSSGSTSTGGSSSSGSSSGSSGSSSPPSTASFEEFYNYRDVHSYAT